jgi:hypothetical protein
LFRFDEGELISMRALIATLLTTLWFSVAIAQGWPILPSTGFVSGRSATEKDVADGNAIFVAKTENRYIGTPIDIAIPQYAYHLGEGGQKTPVIVVQAEEANGFKLVGFRDFQGKEHVATAGEFIFLGTKRPD